MVEIPDKIKTILERYIQILKSNNIPIKCMFLFGSYAKGNPQEYSDIDVAIVSDIFEGVRIKDRKKIREFTIEVSSDLEIIPFTPEDFTVENPFAKEIIETGIQII